MKYHDHIHPRDGGDIAVNELELPNQAEIWLKIGKLTKNGHPRHPSRASYDSMITSFDIHSYLKIL